MGIPLLLLRLEGPLQSWGLRSRWDVRDTGDEPSKSGVIGLLGCALGYGVADPRLTELDRSLHMGVRIERPGTKLIDFHTVSGVMRTAEGKLKGTETDPTTIISPRAYLQDAAFLVALRGSESDLERCATALQYPRWPIYLGRKSCVPTRPVFEELTDRFSSIKGALERYPWERRYPDESPPARLRCVIEDEGGTFTRPDRITPTPARMYEQRQVRIQWVDFPGEALPNHKAQGGGV